jgi:threonine synthase
MSDIKYFSTNLKASKVTFSEALLKGLAPDGGLYMPEEIPLLTPNEIASFREKEYHEIAFLILSKYLGDTIPSDELSAMTEKAYNFEVPLENVFEHKYIMRLDQGPTASFKDFAARMMGQLMQYFLNKQHKNLLILTATSGDTGSAMANAFYNLNNINVAVLFPENEVSPRQRKQMTTLHQNVQILALDGKFDDCQSLVKQAFNDKELEFMNLSSANSINIGRLLPQSVYYIYAYSKLCDISKNEEIIFSVPSGNFGDLMGGLLAMKMGLPVKKFIVATNANDEVPVYFRTGVYKTLVPSKNSISSAMNVGHPSNMARIISLYGGIMNENGEILSEPDIEKMKTDMFTTSIDDNTTRETIKRIYERHKVILEPHGAVGWEGLRQYFSSVPGESLKDQVCVCLETAHPAKFPDEITKTLGIDPELPPSLSGLENKEEQMDKLNPGYTNFKKYLLNKYGA